MNKRPRAATLLGNLEGRSPVEGIPRRAERSHFFAAPNEPSFPLRRTKPFPPRSTNPGVSWVIWVGRAEHGFKKRVLRRTKPPAKVAAKPYSPNEATRQNGSRGRLPA
jgi:hypothetical protein